MGSNIGSDSQSLKKNSRNGSLLEFQIPNMKSCTEFHSKDHIKSKAKSLLRNLKTSKFQAIKQSQILIDCIAKSLKHYLSSIQSRKVQINNFITYALSQDREMIEISQEFKKGFFYDFEGDGKITKIINDIQEAFKPICYDLKLFNNEALLFPGGMGSKIRAIDLETLKTQTLDFSPDLGEKSAVCKVSPTAYFIYGGWLPRSIHSDSHRYGDAYIIDLEKKTCETLLSAEPVSGAGCAFVNPFVYIFGGYSNKRGSEDECRAYSVETQIYMKIADLPERSHSNTAAVVNNKIYLSGYDMGYLFRFEENSYRHSLTLEDDKYKMVASGWVLMTNKLYELKDPAHEKWSLHVVNFKLKALNSYCFYRRQQFIYFVDTDRVLARIDTDSKTVEQVITFSNS